jgi:hypothetical protein
MRAEQAREGGAPHRADLFSAGTLVTAPGGHGTEYGVPIPTLSGADGAQEFVDARLAEGSDWIKLVVDDGSAWGLDLPTLDAATVRAVVAAAHARGRWRWPMSPPVGARPRRWRPAPTASSTSSPTPRPTSACSRRPAGPGPSSCPPSR